MTIQKIEQELNEVIAENFFSYFKQMLTNKTVQKFKRSAEYNSSTELEKQEKTNAFYKKINKDLSTFYLTRKALYAIEPIAEREKKIIEFTSENVHKVYINYIDTEYDFTVSHNSKFTEDMTRERDDLILELRNPKYEHRVANFIEEESEKSPPPPLTNASIKYSAFYLFSFQPEYTTQLLNKLFRVGLITNPDTNGWRIEDETIDELITTLHQVFPSEMVLESKRKYNDIIVDREIKECIRPLYFTTDFYPKNILKQEKFRNIRFEKDIPSEEEDAKKLYDFIFNYTLSTQLNNSKYNTSELVIQVGPHKLKAKSNFLIKGNENWEALIGEKIRTIKEASKDNEDRETVIPFIKIDTKLLPSNIYSHHFNSRTPPRYGVGRFITQILEKNNIATNSEHDEIIENLIASKSIRLVGNMLTPNNYSIELVDFIKEYIPEFYTKDYFYKTLEKIEDTARTGIGLEGLKSEFMRMFDEAFTKAGYEFADKKPSQNKINYAMKLAKKYGVILSDEELNSNTKLDIFIAQFPEKEEIKIGTCPKCNSAVYQKEWIKDDGEALTYYACENLKSIENKCSFSIWDSYIYKFFSPKGIELIMSLFGFSRLNRTAQILWFI